MIWVTSDWHLGHRNIRKFEPSRPPHHEHLIIKRYRETVGPDDTVFHLGDVCFGSQWWPEIKSLPGKKILVCGNHDKKSPGRLKELGGFDEVHRFGEVLVFNAPNGARYVLSHVPMSPGLRYVKERARVADAFDRAGADLNIHGHLHSRRSQDSRCVNVSVEQTDFYPAPMSAG